MATPKDAAVEFLQWVVAGRIDEAYAKHVEMSGKHHNAYYPAGFAVLKEGMKENHGQFPDKKFVIKHVVAEGDYVAVHSQLFMKPGEKEFAVLHLFRFSGPKIAEMWDMSQPVPAHSPNKDGMF